MARHLIASATWREFLCALTQDAEHMLALVAERQRYARIASHPIRRDGWLRVTEALVEVVEVIEAEMSRAASLVIEPCAASSTVAESAAH